VTLAQIILWIFIVSSQPPLLISYVREMGLLWFLGAAVITLSVLALLTGLITLASSVRI
jgi:hypothetical protein